MNYINNWLYQLDDALLPGAATLPAPLAGLNRLSLGAEVEYLLTLAEADGSAHEIVRVIGSAGGGYSLLRGQEGTQEVAWAAGTKIYCDITAGGLSDINGRLIAVESAGSSAGGAAIGDLLLSLRDPGPGYLPADGGVVSPGVYPALEALLPPRWAANTDVFYGIGPQGIAADAEAIIVKSQAGGWRSGDGGAWTNIPELDRYASAICAGYGGVWLSARGNGVDRSFDSGATWAAGGSLPSTPNKIAAGSGARWIAVGYQMAQISADNGATWAALDLGLPHPDGVASDGAGVWVVVAAYEQGRRSTDNGITWAAIDMQAAAVATNGAGVWIALTDTQVLRSADNGITWQVVLDAIQYSSGVAGRGDDWVVAVGAASVSSSDGGLNWTPVSGLEEGEQGLREVAPTGASGWAALGGENFYLYGAGIMPRHTPAPPLRAYVRAG